MKKQQQSFKNGLRAMRLLIREELDKKDAAMKHDHNPAVRPDAQWEYCWRCRIERVLNSEIGSYHELYGLRPCGEDATPVMRCSKCNATLIWKRTDEGFIVFGNCCGRQAGERAYGEER